jgi:hypothetical protein
MSPATAPTSKSRLQSLVATAPGFRVSPRGALRAFTLPLLAPPAVALLWWLDRPLLRRLADEDSVFEWIQVLCFLGAALASAATARALWQRAKRPVALLYGLLAAGLCFVIGEELAWGQRLLGFATPASLASANSKQEVSLHNIESVEHWFTLGKAVIGLYGVFGAWLYARLARGGKLADYRICVVPPFLASPFAIVLGMRALRATLLRNDLPAGYGEFEELVLAYGFAAFTYHTWRRRDSLLSAESHAPQRAHPHPSTRRAPGAA